MSLSVQEAARSVYELHNKVQQLTLQRDSCIVAYSVAEQALVAAKQQAKQAKTFAWVQGMRASAASTRAVEEGRRAAAAEQHAAALEQESEEQRQVAAQRQAAEEQRQVALFESVLLRAQPPLQPQEQEEGQEEGGAVAHAQQSQHARQQLVSRSGIGVGGSDAVWGGGAPQHEVSGPSAFSIA